MIQKYTLFCLNTNKYLKKTTNLTPCEAKVINYALALNNTLKRWVLN